jgi:hypothetical protein
VINLQSKKAKALSGANNKRLTKHRATNSEQTAAWADIDKLRAHSKVPVPPLSSVEEAKEWVDDGSRL